MDPASVVGLVGSVFGIVEGLTKSVCTLRKVQQRWKGVNLTITRLIIHFVTLKAALDQVSAWAQSDLVYDTQYHQVIIDLGVAIDGCRILVLFIADRLEGLDWKDEKFLSFEGKVKALLQHHAMKECLESIERQSSALHLLLTALNRPSWVEQKEFLDSTESRRVLDRVRDDTTSLRVQLDSASIYTDFTGTTTRSSKLSLLFDFDSELMTSRPYRGAFKSIMRRASRIQQTEDGQSSSNPLKKTRTRAQRSDNSFESGQSIIGPVRNSNYGAQVTYPNSNITHKAAKKFLVDQKIIEEHNRYIQAYRRSGYAPRKCSTQR